MVHGEDQVLPQGADRPVVGSLAGEHLDVRAHVAEVRVRLDRFEAEMVPVQPHEQHRDDRGHLQALLADLLRRDIERRLLLEGRPRH